jgi:hypothetical protein
MTVAVLHGELLITLGRETPYASSPRAALERLLFERIAREPTP